MVRSGTIGSIDEKLHKDQTNAFQIGSKEIKNGVLWSMHFRKINLEFWLAYFYANLQIRVCNRCGWNRIRNMSAFEYSTTGMILESVEYKQFKLRLKSDSNRRKYLNWVNQDQVTWPSLTASYIWNPASLGQELANQNIGKIETDSRGMIFGNSICVCLTMLFFAIFQILVLWGAIFWYFVTLPESWKFIRHFGT